MGVAVENSANQDAQAEHQVMQLVRRPKVLADTGLSMPFAADLLSKHLMQSGVLTLNQLTQRIALPSRIVEDIIHFLRKEARARSRAHADRSR